jgi:hypothetical protein
LVIISVLVLEEVPGVIIQSQCSPARGLPRRFCCSLGVVSFYCHEDAISSVFPEIQDDFRVTAERMAQGKDKYKMKAEMPCFSPAFS